MPEGPLGFPRLTSIGPFVKTDDEAEWEEMMEESNEAIEELGFE